MNIILGMSNISTTILLILYLIVLGTPILIAAALPLQTTLTCIWFNNFIELKNVRLTLEKRVRAPKTDNQIWK